MLFTLDRRRSAALACGLCLVTTALGCKRREDPRESAPATAKTALAPAPSPAPAQTPTSLLEWLDSRSPLLLLWRPPLRDASLMADLFALPARSGRLLASALDTIPRTESFLDQALEAPELLSYAGTRGVGTLTILALGYAQHTRLTQQLKVTKASVTQDHEWSCVLPHPQSTQLLCALDAPYVAWVDRPAMQRALQSLREARDLPDNARRREIRETWRADAAMNALLRSDAPTLHLELDEDPTRVMWELWTFGRKDQAGRPGWRGHMQMTHPDPPSALSTLRKAEGLADHPAAQALRQRAHLGQLSPQALEIRLEIHGDDPKASR